VSVVLWYILEHLCLQWNAIQALSDVQWNISISLASWVWVIKAPRWQMLLSVMLMMTNCIIFCVPIRYLIPSLDRSHAGHYRCIVRNRVGAIMQCSTEVQVACKCFFFMHLHGEYCLCECTASQWFWFRKGINENNSLFWSFYCISKNFSCGIDISFVIYLWYDFNVC